MTQFQDSFLFSPNSTKIPRFSTPIKLAVLASGKGSNFEALVNATIESKLDAVILVLVVNKPDCQAIDKAKQLGIPVICLESNKFKSRENYDLELINLLKPYKLDGIIMAGWMRIVTTKLIDEYPDRIINIHPSLLPSFKGINAVGQALQEGVKITGCTVHLVRELIDSGPIIIQAAVPVLISDTHDSLLNRIQSQEHKILPIGVALASLIWRQKEYQG